MSNSQNTSTVDNTQINKVFKLTCGTLFLLTLLASIILSIIGLVRVNADTVPYQIRTEYIYLFKRATTPEEEGYTEEENKICPVEYVWKNKETGESLSFIYNYTYEEWEKLGSSDSFPGQIYRETDGDKIIGFTKKNPDHNDFLAAQRDLYAQENSGLFSAAITLLILSVSFAMISYFGQHFTTYEKSWFLGIMVLAAVFAILFPEESSNGISGIIIMLLYLLDTFLNILCELLISKQSKWNFIVSVFVEITEILICIVLSYRFATMATTLFFWLPIDIISFINWNRKKNTDENEAELTKVRTLKGWQEIVIIAGIAVWTLVVGYFLSGLDITSDLFGGNDVLADVVCYIDACASAVGIVNGLAILFRFREQWIAWYICSALEAIINILAGQYVLLVLKLGYLTNTTYGYLKWTKYIKAHPEIVEQKSFF